MASDSKNTGETVDFTSIDAPKAKIVAETAADDWRAELQAALLDWFAANGRDFAWRRVTDPFPALVAEKLLQQTAVATGVEAVFEILAARYPDALSLSRADPAEVRGIVGRLGLPRRAEEMVRMASEIVERHDGNVPATDRELMALTGIGEYAARAVLSFVFGQDIAIVDTNVARFLFRLFGLSMKFPANPARNRILLEMADSLVPPGRSRSYNLAVLDLCAAVCKPGKPLCERCPVRRLCEYGRKSIRREQ